MSTIKPKQQTERGNIMFTMIKKTNDGWRRTMSHEIWNDAKMDAVNSNDLWVIVDDHGPVAHPESMSESDIVWAVKSSGLKNPTEQLEIETDRCIENVGHAMNAFWDLIAASYPEIKSGDYPPDLTIQFQMQCVDAVTAWIKINKPETDGE